jgi:hypothetical protein
MEFNESFGLPAVLGAEAQGFQGVR